MRKLRYRPFQTMLMVVLLTLSQSISFGQHPFVTSCASKAELPESIQQVVRERTARLVRGTTAFPGGRSSALIVKPFVRLEGDTLPAPSLSGRALRLSGELIIEFRSPGALTLLGQADLPFQGKGRDAESALMDGLMSMEADQNMIMTAYDEAYRQQEIKWNNCTEFLSSCKALADKNRWPEAFLLLGSIPPGTPCSHETDALWETWMEQQAKKRCSDLVQAAKAAQEEHDDHRLLTICVAADQDCQMDFWKKAISGLQSRITEEQKGDYKLLTRLANRELHPDDQQSNLLALLFEQVMADPVEKVAR